MSLKKDYFFDEHRSKTAAIVLNEMTMCKRKIVTCYTAIAGMVFRYSFQSVNIL